MQKRSLARRSGKNYGSGSLHVFVNGYTVNADAVFHKRVFQKTSETVVSYFSENRGLYAYFCHIYARAHRAAAGKRFYPVYSFKKTGSGNFVYGFCDNVGNKNAYTSNVIFHGNNLLG